MENQKKILKILNDKHAALGAINEITLTANEYIAYLQLLKAHEQPHLWFKGAHVVLEGKSLTDDL